MKGANMPMAKAERNRWQRENDAHTLAEAETIKADKARLKGAQKEAKNMVKQQEQRIQGLRAVSQRASSTTNTSVAKKRGISLTPK